MRTLTHILLATTLTTQVALAQDQKSLKDYYTAFAEEKAATYTSGGNAAGLELFKKAYQSDPKKNRMYSPQGIAAHMSLLLNILSPGDAAEIQHASGWDSLKLDEINASSKLLTDWSKLTHRDYELVLVNGAWADSSFDTSASAEAFKKYYGVEFTPVDFKKDETATTINNWVKKETRETIDQVVTSQTLKSTNVFLANTLYMNAKWRTDFLTVRRPMNFKTPDPEKPGQFKEKPAQFMNSRDSANFKAIKNEAYDLVEVPYSFGSTVEAFGDQAHGQATMVVVVPKGEHTLDEIVGLVSSEQLTAWNAELSKTQPRWMGLMLPKWKLKFQDDQFGKLLSDVGYKRLFEPGLKSSTGQELFLTQIGQKGFIEVGETGTKAGFVTFSGFGVSSSIPSYSLRADRPFLYYIRDTASGTILVVGTVIDPTLTE